MKAAKLEALPLIESDRATGEASGPKINEECQNVKFSNSSKIYQK
ncbi:hypothetical protein NEOC65_002293 [Neochlamydia sp. AcF65]|nr:hypothetical protein [Neochlamydia sp. AcF65]